ncbi:hypothetical protein Baya_15594 [Bagarius yarrelli]|uniref:Uncharacterized protein n=1 Tax=Bagarius yarrelli TaxID=175774 RepID=A0A556VCQ5_BAGYA|nr:hypothetical protein Baya_15594 [Bagarius yarrelli]
MKSLVAEDHLDEVHCLWALCPHPCCWETERRITEGIYRRAVRTQGKRRSDAEENSPFLSLVDVSDWSTLSSGGTAGRKIPPPRRDAGSRLKTTGQSFPAITSAENKWHTGESGSRSKTPKKTTKRVRFQWAESVSPGQLKAGTGDHLKTSAVVNDLRDLRDLSVRNKPAVFHSMREKRVGRASQGTPASVYKLDSKTGEGDVDWDRLRGQPYLWNRNNIPPEYVSPPGGTREAQETVGSPFVSKPSSDRTLCSPKFSVCEEPDHRVVCNGTPVFLSCEKAVHHTYPLLSGRRSDANPGVFDWVLGPRCDPEVCVPQRTNYTLTEIHI